MAVYRIGDILRMKREALGITREKLCEMSEEVCSPQTLYRMESGKVKVKQDVYRKLMECMGELPERSYASVLVSDYRALNKKKELQINLAHRDYEQAEIKIEELEEFMDLDYVRNKQCILKSKSIITYSNCLISPEEHIENLLNALRYTIPNLDKIEWNGWPYNCEEFDVVIDILNVYHKMKLKEEEEKILLQLKQNTEKRYMEEGHYVSRHIQCLVGLSQLMSMACAHEKSMEYCTNGIKESKTKKIVGMIFNLLYDMAWNKEQMIQKKMIDEKERESCKRLLVQAYYLSIAQKIDHSSERIKRLYETTYAENFIMF